jgi:hypothetical protein
MKPVSAPAVCLLVLLARAPGTPAVARPPGPTSKAPVSVTLKVPNKPLKAGTDLVLRATVKNTSDHDIIFPTSPGLIPSDGLRYDIQALDEQAQPAPPSARVLAQRATRGKGGPGVAVIGNTGHTLKPGQSLVEEINVTRYYDLSRPGTYTIWVIHPLPLQVPPWAAKKYWKGFVRSNTITVTVVK